MSTRLDQALNRAGLRSTFSRDVLLAVVLAVVSAGLVLLLFGSFADSVGVSFAPAETAATVVIVTLQGLALALRRVRPATCLVVVAGLQAGLAAVLPWDITVREMAPLVAAYSAGTCLSTRRLVRWVGVAVLVEVFGSLAAQMLLAPAVRGWLGLSPAPEIRAGEWLLQYGLAALLYGTAAVVGVLVATRRRNVELLQARAEAAVRDQELRTARALEAERLRMARELHDIAAHHLTGLVVQAAAVERLVVLGGDGAAARQAARTVRAEGKEALANLRLMVGMLRERGEVVEIDGPVPGLAVIDQLVASARALGDDIEVEVVGQAYALPQVADVSVYRVLQEALTNARQHAPGRPVRVRLDYGPDRLVLEVVNRLGPNGSAGRAGRPGFGLLGMRERAALVQADLEAGPTAGSAREWRVRLTVPRPAVAEEVTA